MYSTWIVVGLVVRLFAAPAEDGERMRMLYHQGVRLFGQQKYGQARAAFSQLLPLLKRSQKRRKQGSRGWHLMSLGQCDVMYHLAQIAERAGKPRRACRIYRSLFSTFRTVPEAWKTWNVYPNLPAHMNTASARWKQFCPTVPSILSWRVSPARATVERLGPSGQWIRLSGQSLALKATSITLRFSAPGFQPQILKQLKIPRWGTRTLKIALKKGVVLARVRPRPRRRMPPVAEPITKKWWFWTALVGGVVLVGAGVTVGVLLGSSGEGKFTGSEGTDDFSLW